MPSIKGTQTELCLLKAFAGESQARNRYTYFASVAKKEGYEQISALFTRDRRQREGAREGLLQVPRGWRHRDHGDVSRRQDRHHRREPSGRSRGRARRVGHHLPRLRRRSPSPRASRTSPTSFREIAEVEAHHETRYRKLLENVNGFKVFKKDGVVFWKCRNCGYVYEGASAPIECPACHHPQAYFELLCDNF